MIVRGYAAFGVTYPTLKLGDTDNSLPDSQAGSVSDLQRALANAGYAVGEIDGIFGPATLAALKSFQGEHGLAATGIADTATWAALLPGQADAPPRASTTLGTGAKVAIAGIGVLILVAGAVAFAE